jgi:hypothetical protein
LVEKGGDEVRKYQNRLVELGMLQQLASPIYHQMSDRYRLEAVIQQQNAEDVSQPIAVIRMLVKKSKFLALLSM